MLVDYRRIVNGSVVDTKRMDYEGIEDINDRIIQSDIYDGCDPLQMAMEGKEIYWIEATEVK